MSFSPIADRMTAIWTIRLNRYLINWSSSSQNIYIIDQIIQYFPKVHA